MKKSGDFTAAYDALSRIRRGPLTDEAVSELRRVINGRASVLVSMAVDIAAERELHDLIPDMISAFERFMVDGSKVDKQCNAKISVVKALNKLEYSGDEVFLSGAHYVQMEGSYGPPVDTAVEVRTGCAYGLARLEHSEALYVLTDLLVDPQAAVRAASARALGHLARPESELLLRLKVLVGDEESDVIRECLESLMAMIPERSLDFAARYLQSKDSMIAQSAALAIGGSRIPRAYDKLRECWDDFPSPTARRMLLLPIAIVRSDEAFAFLLETAGSADAKTAAEAVSALRIYTSEDSVRRIAEVVTRRNDAELLRVFEAEFEMPCD